MGQAETSSIPMLTDVLVPGHPAPARRPEAGLPQDDAAIPVLTDVIAPGNPAAVAPEAAAQTVPAPETAAPADIEAGPATVVVQPVPTPEVPVVELAPVQREAEAPEMATQAAETAAALTPEDTQHIAERLRDRLTNYLTGEGREAIEARCRDALHGHTAWLVSQITREVALALETEVMDWVRDAVDDEIARRRIGHSS
ncbi:hypothetical protein WM34_03100 [Burkholderia ubonensis]|uniref:DUF2486 family protein n=1 Tax=Burkholderia ubonensis TaxID=101571 RepID=UPI000751B6B5|nr:DUF2486 family protein [Burkholderia ubonensis]KWC03893.1 hypothetical protein WL44_27010 [Burkholderia ubonensis]KWC39763.1 hypothetical protein WL51_10320 [Burkholderia ubonensis]KWD08997.1 hypothetical protein WL59_05345 [Burkholderia ubonensis]KWD09263.1 hypothetical protein WL60_24005 [Burkholderia ubonensis]KWO91300.1 hypothetical protein WM34_03100 [Burkholderia ubonensis]